MQFDNPVIDINNGGAMSRWVLLLLLPSAACHKAIEVGLEGIANPKLREEIFAGPTFDVELEPTPSPVLMKGERRSLLVTALLRDGKVCQYCEAKWSSTEPEVAAFSEPAPRCPGGRCATLEALGEGTTVLTVKVC